MLLPGARLDSGRGYRALIRISKIWTRRGAPKRVRLARYPPSKFGVFRSARFFSSRRSCAFSARVRARTSWCAFSARALFPHELVRFFRTSWCAFSAQAVVPHKLGRLSATCCNAFSAPCRIFAKRSAFSATCPGLQDHLKHCPNSKINPFELHSTAGIIHRTSQVLSSLDQMLI